MWKKLALVFVAVFMFSQLDAQIKRGYVKRKYAELGAYGGFGYYGNAHYAGGVDISYTWGLGSKKQRSNLGAGLRMNSFFTQDRYYKTSSLELAALNRGGADSLFFKTIQTNTLNIFVTFQFHIKQGVDIYFNTDIGGINFGDGREAAYLSYENNPDFNTSIDRFPVDYYTEPYAFNLNMYNQSYGTIMSELYGSFRINELMGWRLGLMYYRNEYVTIRDVPMNGKRFSQSNWMGTLGVTFNLRQHRTIYDDMR
jgi:hypothetical protein